MKLTSIMSSPIRLSQRAQRAVGQPIGELMAQALASPELISLAAGFVDQATLPDQIVQQAMDSLFADPSEAQAALQYGTTAGFEPLRQIVIDRLLQADGGGVDPGTDRVVLTAGSNQLLHLVAETILGKGDIVLCAAPTYLVYMGIVQNVGASSYGIVADDDGIIPEALEATLQQLDDAGDLARVKAIYAVSYFDNPCSLTISRERRAELLDIVRRWSREGKIYILEDVAYREIRYEGEDLPSIWSHDPTGEHVIVAGTYSKSFSPGMRVGWGILPEELVGPVLNQKDNIDFGSPALNQRLIAKVHQLDLYDSHVLTLRANYMRKMEAMLAAADEHLAGIPGVSWQRPRGGIYIWLRLPESLHAGPEGPLFDQTLQEGMFYVPGQYCYPSHGTEVEPNTIRLSFGVADCDSIAKGISALGRAIRHCLS